MKISLNWLKTFIDIDLDDESLKDLLTDIGLEVEGVETYESVPGGLKGLVVAEVLTCVPHPNADKLKLTTVTTGSGEPLRIVCGAPNVAAGQKVVLAPVGTKLFPTGHEPFEIKKAKIRGEESNGMLCAEDEIGLGESHEGIIVLPEDAVPGTPAAKIYNVIQDTVFEIGLTPNRTDAQSHYGVARDLAAAINFRYGKNLSLKFENAEVSLGDTFPVRVEVENPELAARYAGLVIEGIKIAPSPEWLQNRLQAIGQKPLNNVVDITNYILHAYGQPLHAFDMAVVGDTIKVKTLEAGTIFKTLDGEEVKLHEEDLMICNADSPMCIAGVYGGIDSGVKESTTAVFLESAYFNPTSVRKTSMRHNLRTEAAQHFEKGVNPVETASILKIAAKMITELAGGQIVSGLTDVVSEKFEKNIVQLSPDKVRKITGAPISNEEIKTILQLLEIDADTSREKWELRVPLYRADVTRDVDVIEDILRIYGYNNVPIPNEVTAAIPVKKGLDKDLLYKTAANHLVSNGYYEILNNSLTRSKSIEGWINPERFVRLLSSINVELDILRPYMHSSALEVISYNINRSQKNLKLFEYGKTYVKENDGYREDTHLFLTVTGEKQPVNWITPKESTDFYYIKGILESLLTRIGVRYSAVKEGKDTLHDYLLTYYVGKQEVASVGKISASIVKGKDISQDVYMADIQWDKIVMFLRKSAVGNINVSKFPPIRRDLALLLDKNIKFTEVRDIAVRYGKKQLKEIELFDVYEGDKIAEDKKSYAVSFTFRDEEKTMSDKEIDRIMNDLMEQYSRQLHATVRGQE